MQEKVAYDRVPYELSAITVLVHLNLPGGIAIARIVVRIQPLKRHKMLITHRRLLAFVA